MLSCHVSHLGSYKVAWVRVDTQTILTIHNSIITRCVVFLQTYAKLSYNFFIKRQKIKGALNFTFKGGS